MKMPASSPSASRSATAPVSHSTSSPASHSTSSPASHSAGPSLRPPISREKLDRDRQELLFANEHGPATTINRGNAGEAEAAAYLERIGMRVIERNFKTKLGELDIIAREGMTLVFVEVRMRSTNAFGNAVEMVNHHKQRQVSRIASQYLRVRRPRFDTARFDVVGITAGEVVHIRDAWRLS